MNSRFTPLIVFALGIVCLGIGIVLRFHAANLGAAALSGGPAKMIESMMDPKKGNYSEVMSLAQRSNATYDIALPLLWTGAALMVAAAVAQLFVSARRPRHPSSAEPGSFAADHPVLGDLR